MFLTALALAGLSFPVGRNGVENALDSPSCAWGSGFGPNKGQMGSSLEGPVGAPERAVNHDCQTDSTPANALHLTSPQNVLWPELSMAARLTLSHNCFLAE